MRSPHCRTWSGGLQRASDRLLDRGRAGRNKRRNQSVKSIVGDYSFTLQVRDSSGNTATGIYGLSILPAQQGNPSITILAPNGGETWAFGQPQTITWTESNISSDISAYLFSSGRPLCFLGTTKPVATSMNVTLQNGQMCNSGWSIVPGQYQIGLYAGEPTAGTFQAKDFSNGFVTLANAAVPASITVTSPVAGNTWIAGSAHQITWNANQNVWMLKLYKGGVFVQTIATFTQDTPWYSWTIPAATQSGNDYTVRAYAKDGVTYGESGQFSIVNTAIPPSVIPTPIIPITPIVPISSTPNPTGTLAIATSAYLPTPTVSQPYTTTIAATGGSAPYTWTFVSSDQSNFGQSGFPAGSGLSFNGGTGASATISGTPSALAAGHEYPFTLKVASGGQTASQSFVLYVSPGTSNGTGFAASVVLVTPPNWQQPGTVGQPYSATFLAANEPEGTYQWSIASGTLPPGLSLTGGTGSQTTIAGRPTTAGSYAFTLRVSSTYGGSMQNQYNITIYPSTVTPPLTTSGGGVSVQESGASSQQSALMASVLESIKGILDQIQKLAL